VAKTKLAISLIAALDLGNCFFLLIYLSSQEVADSHSPGIGLGPLLLLLAFLDLLIQGFSPFPPDFPHLFHKIPQKDIYHPQIYSWSQITFIVP